MTKRRAPLLLVVLLAGVLAGFVLPADDLFSLRKNFTIFGRLYEELAGHYVDDLNAEYLMRSGIDAMLADLDPYTVFLDEADNADIGIITRGRYGGVGITVGERGGRLVVIEVLEGYSAHERGLRAGDVIVEIEGEDVTDLSSEQVRGLLRGSPGTVLRLSVNREGEPAPVAFVLNRTEVQLANVTYHGFVGEEEDGIAYLRLERFTQGAAREARAALQDLGRSGPLQGVVLDLRGNPGGLLDEAVGVSGLFLPEGTVVVSMRGRAPETARTFRSQGAPLLPNVPVTVLVDNVSASASEIVAGAMQDHDRGVVIGEATFGKGLVQSIRPLPYNTSLKVTTARYYTPSGRSIQAVTYGRNGAAIADDARRAFRTTAGRRVLDGRGIEPDVAVSLGRMSELEEALTRSAAFFLFANRFAGQNATLPPDFSVTDALLTDFQRFIEAEDVPYDTRAERALGALGAELDSLGYAEASAPLASLRAAIAREKAADFQRHAPRIRERLRREIASRYGGQQSQIRASLIHDEPLSAAVEILTNGRYGRLLGP